MAVASSRGIWTQPVRLCTVSAAGTRFDYHVRHARLAGPTFPSMIGPFSLLTESAIAIALGLMIGLEREHGELARLEHAPSGKPPEILLGVRSFALLSLFGWLSG